MGADAELLVLPLEIEGREALLLPEFEGMEAEGKLLDELELEDDGEGMLGDELEGLDELELEDEGEGMLGEEGELELEDEDGMLGMEAELDEDCWLLDSQPSKARPRPPSRSQVGNVEFFMVLSLLHSGLLPAGSLPSDFHDVRAHYVQLQAFSRNALKFPASQ